MGKQTTPWSSQRSCCPCSNTCRNTTGFGWSWYLSNPLQMMRFAGLLMEHGSPQVGWDVKQLDMNSRMRSHDVILPTWKSSRISLFSGTVRFVAILRFVVAIRDDIGMTIDHPSVLLTAKARWNSPSYGELLIMHGLDGSWTWSFHHSLLIRSHLSKDPLWN